MKIIRKDGIEYERKRKDVNYDTSIYIRLSSQMLNNLKEIASKQNMNFTKLCREILENYVMNYKIWNEVEDNVKD